MQRVAIFLQHPRNLLLTAGVISGGVLCVKSAPHVFPGLVFRPIYQAQKQGQPCELVPNQKKEFLEVCRDMGIKPKGFDVFVSNQLDIRWRGLPWLPSGVKFGMPETLQDNPDVSKKRFNESIKANMDSEDGHKLQEALGLSQNARKFALAKEMAIIEKKFPMYSIILAPCVVSANFGLVALVQVTNVIGLPNYLLLILTCVPFYCMYQLVTSTIRERIDLKTDRELAELGPEYVKGGVEYYEKRLERNCALRKLLGKKGEQLFTYYGNEKPSGIFGLHSYGVALTQKLNNMKKALTVS